jgi:serine/threonine protein kinase
MTSTEPGISENRYELIELIGGREHLAVWKALDRQTDGFVTIETLAPGLSEAAIAHIEKQWRSLVRLPPHPLVAAVLDAGRIFVNGRSTPFFSMPMFLARTLPEWSLHERTRLSPSDVVGIVSQVGKGLQALHDAGFAHAGLRSGDILLFGDLSACIRAGFGMAAGDAVAGANSLEALRYSSPEQIQGGRLSVASDVFSLAVVCYELLTGRRPFDGETAEAVSEAILTFHPLPISNHPLGAVLQRAMAKQPGERPGTVSGFVSQLQQSIQGNSGSGAPMPVEKGHLLDRRARLLDAMYSRRLDSVEESDLAAIEHRLDEIEAAEADDFDRGYPESRAGKIEAALDRLEESIRAIPETRRKTA